MHFYVDSTYVKNDILNVVGWAAGEDPKNPVEFHVFSKGQEIPVKVTRNMRPDVGYAYFNDPTKSDLGMFIEVPCPGNEVYTVEAWEVEDGFTVDRVSVKLSRQIISARKKGKELYQKGLSAFMDFRHLVGKVLRREYHKYAAWFQTYRATPFDLQKQREEHFPYAPLISVLVPVFRTPVPYLRDMIGSVLQQTYGNFQLVIVNGDPSDEKVAAALLQYAQADPRVQVFDLPDNLGIAGNTNAALSHAEGEYIAMLDHDDVLEYDALYHYVKKLNEAPETDLLYCDEDKITERSDYFFYPNFKPDFNPDMLYHNNYICHFLMVRKALAEEVGGWSDAYNGAQDYDFILKCVERTQNIVHIPRILYHWRSYGGSTSKKAANKDYAARAGADALNAFYERNGIPAHAEPSAIGGWYHSVYQLAEKPLISVLIPNKDHTDDLEVCLKSIFKKCTYPNLEVLIIENNSTDPRTFEYYRALPGRYPKARVLFYDGGFNFSRINNFGFREAKGELIMLLNNDTEVITPEIFENMAGYLSRKEVGMVGAKLLYNDNTIQHAGVLVGGGGIADHLFKGEGDNAPGYMCRAVTPHDLSAVTAACIMLRREVYEEVGGLDESFAVAFNDVDFCLKIRQAGYLIVYDANSKLYHYESKSRGAEDTPEKFVRFGDESYRLNKKWGILTDFKDPYYNPNMSYLFYFKPDFPSMPAKMQETADTYVRLCEPETLNTLAKRHVPWKLRRKNLENELKARRRAEAKNSCGQ